MLNRYLNKFERRFRRFAIDNLMLYIIIGMGVVYIAAMLTTNPDINANLIDMIWFDRDRIMQGQVWRVISFVLMPPMRNIFFTILTFYFYWFMGTGLERKWGSFKFNIFFFTGVLFSIAAGFITGYANNYYLFLGMFLAFALLFPNEILYVFFVLPVKVKWLGLLDAALLIWDFVRFGSQVRIFMLLSMANLLIFLGRDIVDIVYYAGRRLYYKYIKK